MFYSVLQKIVERLVFSQSGMNEGRLEQQIDQKEILGRIVDHVAGVIVQNKVVAHGNGGFLHLSRFVLDCVGGRTGKHVGHLNAGVGVLATPRSLVASGHIYATGDGNEFLGLGDGLNIGDDLYLGGVLLHGFLLFGGTVILASSLYLPFAFLSSCSCSSFIM